MMELGNRLTSVETKFELLMKQSPRDVKVQSGSDGH